MQFFQKKLHPSVTFEQTVRHPIEMDRSQFEHFGREIRPHLHAAARKVLSGVEDVDAESADVVQDTLLRLWTARSRLDQYSSLEGVAVITVRRLAISRLRHLKSCSTVPIDFADPEIYDTADDLPDPLMPELDAILSRLPVRQALVLRMRHMDGLENNEIAALTGISPTNVRVLLSRARQNLRNLFSQQL